MTLTNLIDLIAEVAAKRAHPGGRNEGRNTERSDLDDSGNFVRIMAAQLPFRSN